MSERDGKLKWWETGGESQANRSRTASVLPLVWLLCPLNSAVALSLLLSNYCSFFEYSSQSPVNNGTAMAVSCNGLFDQSHRLAASFGYPLCTLVEGLRAEKIASTESPKS